MVCTMFLHTHQLTQASNINGRVLKKGSELPIQVIQRNDNGDVVDIFDFETDETSYWKAIKKFEELIEEKN